MKKEVEDLIYFKFEKEEFVELRKMFLSLEKSFLETLKNVKDFNDKRKKEFLLKEKLRKSLKSAKVLMGKTLTNLPEVKKYKEHKDNLDMKTNFSAKGNSELDRQLQDIKNQLSKIGA